MVQYSMERSSNELIEGVIDHIIDEETLGVCFEIHRSIKLQYYDVVNPDLSSIERHDIVDEPGRDVFGNNVQSFRKPVECICPSCQRTLGATKFAPHLEKCLGMGRTSSRLAAHKRPTATRVESEGEHSDDNEDEWTYPERKGGIGPRITKKMKKDRFVLSNPPLPRKPTTKPVKDTLLTNGVASSSSDGFYALKPSLQQHNAASFSALPSDYKHQLLQQICGAISERTGKLCTRTVKCPQHSEDDRKEVRRKFLESRLPVDVTGHRSSHRLTGTTPVHDESQLRTEYSSNYTIEADDSFETSSSSSQKTTHRKTHNDSGCNSNKKHRRSAYHQSGH